MRCIIRQAYALQRSSDSSQGQRFRLKEKAYGQFAQSYFVRLTAMKAALKAVAAKEFPNTPGARHHLLHSIHTLLYRCRPKQQQRSYTKLPPA